MSKTNDDAPANDLSEDELDQVAGGGMHDDREISVTEPPEPTFTPVT